MVLRPTAASAVSHEAREHGDCCLGTDSPYLPILPQPGSSVRRASGPASSRFACCLWLRLPWAAVRGLCSFVSFAFRALVSSCSSVCPLCWLPWRLVYVRRVRILDSKLKKNQPARHLPAFPVSQPVALPSPSAEPSPVFYSRASQCQSCSGPSQQHACQRLCSDYASARHSSTTDSRHDSILISTFWRNRAAFLARNSSAAPAMLLF